MTGKLTSDERLAMDEVAEGLPTKSAKIRALNSAGYSRSQIANYLEIRYQHVRNVLVQGGESEPPSEVPVFVGPGGRIVIPAPYRQSLGLSEGDQVMLRLVDDEVRMVSRRSKIREAQELVAKFVPENVSLTDALMADRRREAAQEEGGSDGGG